MELSLLLKWKDPEKKSLFFSQHLAISLLNLHHQNFNFRYFHLSVMAAVENSALMKNCEAESRIVHFRQSFVHLPSAPPQQWCLINCLSAYGQKGNGFNWLLKSHSCTHNNLYLISVLVFYNQKNLTKKLVKKTVKLDLNLRGTLFYWFTFSLTWLEYWFYKVDQSKLNCR